MILVVDYFLLVSNHQRNSISFLDAHLMRDPLSSPVFELIDGSNPFSMLDSIYFSLLLGYSNDQALRPAVAATEYEI